MYQDNQRHQAPGGHRSSSSSIPPRNADHPSQTQPSHGPTTVSCLVADSVTRSPSPWTTPEVEAISELIGLRCAGGSAEFLPASEPGLDPVVMDYCPHNILDETISTELDESRVFDMRELVSPDIDIREGSQIRTRNVVQFALLAKPRGDLSTSDAQSSAPSSPATKWTIPEPKEFHSLVNRAEVFMYEKRLPCCRALKWANLWGKVGLLGLSARHPQDIDDFRAVVEGLATENFMFTIFPKEAIENRGSISVLLRENFKEITPTCLPAAIFRRNKGLKGALRSTHVKTYGKEDKTRNGVSKHGWRLILLQGCPIFMRSLEAYDEDERFALGSGFIYIRGGVRKPRRTNGSGGSNGRGGSRQQRTMDQRGPSNRPSTYRSNFPTITEERTTGQQDRAGPRREQTDGRPRRASDSPEESRHPASSSAWGNR